MEQLEGRKNTHHFAYKVQLGLQPQQRQWLWIPPVSFFKNRAILLQVLFQDSFEAPHCSSMAVGLGAQESAAIKSSAPATGVLW